VVFRRELVERCGDFDESMRRAEDYELWTRFLLSGSRAAFVPDPLGYYRLRADSLSASKDQWSAHLSVLERHLPELWAHGARGRARDVFEIAEQLAARGDRRQAVRFFRQAVTEGHLLDDSGLHGECAHTLRSQAELVGHWRPAVVLHVVTVHWRDDRWIEPQLRFLRRNLPAGHASTSLNGIHPSFDREFFYAADLKVATPTNSTPSPPSWPARDPTTS
jgi:hypothetical protein